MSRVAPGRGLPMEIIENIIDNAPDGPTFLACSLVCREWLYRCRFYLFQRYSFAAGDAKVVLPRLAGAEFDQKSQKWRTRDVGISIPSKARTLSAGWFVQSLIITESSPTILSTSQEQWETIRQLIYAIPNVREMQLIGVTEWALERYLDGVLGRWSPHLFSLPEGEIDEEPSKEKKEINSGLGELPDGVKVPRAQLEDLTLRHVRTWDWSSVSIRIAACSRTLRSLRINSLRFVGTKEKVEQAQSNLQILETLPDSISQSSSVTAEVEGGDDGDNAIKFERLERLAIEAETPGHPFAEQLLNDILKTPSEYFSKLSTVELPSDLLPKAKGLFTAAKSTITTLIIHCESFTGAALYDAPRSYSANIDISSLIRLTELHVVGIRANSAYSAPAIAILDALTIALRKFPYSTIKKLHISFTTMLSYSPFKVGQWNDLDDAIALPHIAARLEDVELAGVMSLAGHMGRFLPKSRERRMLRLLS